jgi:hypothetical protein
MTQLNPLLKDKQGKTIQLHQLSYITGISPSLLIEILSGKKGYGIKKSVYLSMICKQQGYDFPPETFMSSQDLKLLNYILEDICKIEIKPYNPLL